MQQPTATVSITLDRRRIKKDKTYPVKLRITYKRLSKYYRTAYHLNKTDYKKVMTSHPRGEFKELRFKFQAVEEHALQVIQNMSVFSFAGFEELFIQKRASNQDVFAGLLAYYEQLEANNQLSTATVYKSAYSALKKFHRRKRLDYEEVTPMFLKKFELHLLGKGNSITTISIHCRSLLCIFHRAIADKIIPSDIMPFGRDKYPIPKSRNIKKSLPADQLRKLLHYQPNTDEEYYFSLWLFSYFGNGMNIKDICNLRYKDIAGEYIHFFRSKVSGRQSTSKPVSFFICEQLQKIIAKWGQKPVSPETYIFPILAEGMSAQQAHKKRHDAITAINRHMKSIGGKLEIPQKITTYTARHSFATILKNSGQSVAFISEALGHSNIATTEHYLGSFEDEAKKHISALLFDEL